MGIIQATTFVHLAASLDHSEIAIAGASWFLAQSVGGLLGASLSTAAIGLVLRNNLEAALAGIPGRDRVGFLPTGLCRAHADETNQIIARILSDVNYIQEMPVHLWKPVSQSYVAAIACSNRKAPLKVLS